MIKYAVTYNPREPETIDEVLNSIRQVGIKERIYIFAEPNEHKFKDENIRVITNTEKKGCFKNFDYMLQYMNSIINDDDYLFTFQSDYIFRYGIKKEIERIVKQNKNFGYYNFILHRLNLDNVKKEGWNEYKNGWSLSGASFLFKKKTLNKIINHPFYINHLENYKRNQQVDACIGETCKLLNLKGYIPSKSWVKHIGNSTIGHNDLKKGEFIEKFIT